MSDDGSAPLDDLFTEPSDYYPPPPPPTQATHTLLDGREIKVSLVGHNPLWGHHLWNAGRVLATHFDTYPDLIRNKSVLELGAAAGLPSLVCALRGAQVVVATDYPDTDLIANLAANVERVRSMDGCGAVEAEGLLWGASPESVLSHLPKPAVGFDVLVLADLLFNHSEHAKLVLTLQQTLRKSPHARAYVYFTPYRPWLLEKDLAFFDVAREGGFRVEKVSETVMERVMFEEDRGDELLRRTVFGYELAWAEGV
ncbi:hypothetical protein EJ06DRAFT_558817 [Trichodelitschia bisporula]|uniref:Protein N-terminal and lysine N-methyltransferase EFM7 n=1 Tax=Trichodelitschia bisporula TaxID=703511 RepID=A0A6G1HPT2_9PEZI|nr:hypothetical protein EJ06DRAFT_558817 [Trichodelitschia bisporula]